MGQGSIVEWADETEAQAHLQEVVLRRFGWTITLRRGPSGRLSDIAFRGSRAETLGYWNLMTLPEDRFTALEVDLDGTPWDAGWADIVEPAVARLRSLERVVTPEGTRTPTPTVALAAAEARRPSVDLGGVSCMAWTADDRLVLAGPGAVVTLDASGQVVHTEQPDEVPTSLAFAGNVSVRATKAGLALGDGRHIPTDPLYNVVLSGDGRLLVGMANTAEIWDLEAGVRLKRMAAKGTWLASTAITPDGALVALGMQNGTIDVRPVEGRKRHPSFHGHTTRVSVLAWSADATRVLSGCDAGTLRCWDAATGEQLWLV
ncbi:MAG: hypothetical protein KC656_35925, partial [Myxococcales bacterium]|nr:hypothetical protein [Myxococcales bacterium]